MVAAPIRVMRGLNTEFFFGLVIIGGFIYVFPII
jgi:hypothetical protein